MQRQVRISTFAWKWSEVIKVSPKVFLQFNEILSKISEKDSAQELENAFELFDVDNDGHISFEDLKMVA